MNEPQYKAVTDIIEKALEHLSGNSRFDKLVSLRDEAARLVNAERENEMKRVAADRERLKAQLKEQRERLRAVSTITKPRARKAAAAAPETQVLSS